MAAGRERRNNIRALMKEQGFSYAVAERVVDGVWTIEEANGYGVPQEGTSAGGE